MDRSALRKLHNYCDLLVLRTAFQFVATLPASNLTSFDIHPCQSSDRCRLPRRIGRVEACRKAAYASLTLEATMKRSTIEYVEIKLEQ